MKIGIRPVIDGREGKMGIRERLEKQTMGMAKAAKKLIESNIRDRTGAYVECVISDTTIGGTAEAAMCQKRFSALGVCGTLTVTPCWCYGSETMDMDKTVPKAIWGFNGSERPALAAISALSSCYTQKGIPVFSIYGQNVQESETRTIPGDVKEKILRWARCVIAMGQMKGRSYLSVGSVSMGLAESIVNPTLLEKYFGMRIEFKDMSEIVRRIEYDIYDQEEFRRAYAWVKENCKENSDIYNGASGKNIAERCEDWRFSVKMTMIMRDMMVGSEYLQSNGWREEGLGCNAIVAGFQGQRQWTDFLPSSDFMEAIMCSSFDWNGVRPSYVVATENDCYTGLSMLIGHLLTNSAPMFNDVRMYWSPEAYKRVTGRELPEFAKDGLIHLLNSGAMCLDACGEQKRNNKPVLKPFWEITPLEVERCLEKTRWTPADLAYFRGGGFSSTFRTSGNMPITLFRMSWVDGIGPVLKVIEGYSCQLDPEAAQELEDRTDPGWPSTWFVPILTGSGAFKDVYSVITKWGGNHGASVYGHIGADILTLAAMLRIPVSMHNVSDDRIQRPSAWNEFGTDDLESADYRACHNYGPFYK